MGTMYGHRFVNLPSNMSRNSLCSLKSIIQRIARGNAVSVFTAISLSACFCHIHRFALALLVEEKEDHLRQCALPASPYIGYTLQKMRRSHP